MSILGTSETSSSGGRQVAVVVTQNLHRVGVEFGDCLWVCGQVQVMMSDAETCHRTSTCNINLYFFSRPGCLSSCRIGGVTSVPAPCSADRSIPLQMAASRGEGRLMIVGQHPAV